MFAIENKACPLSVRIAWYSSYGTNLHVDKVIIMETKSDSWEVRIHQRTLGQLGVLNQRIRLCCI